MRRERQSTGQTLLVLLPFVVVGFVLDRLHVTRASVPVWVGLLVLSRGRRRCTAGRAARHRSRRRTGAATCGDGADRPAGTAVPPAGRVPVAGWWLLLTAYVWLVPSTVVDAHGFRTLHRLRRRTVPWTDVADVPDFGPGLAPLRVKVRLTEGQQRTLPHVSGTEVPFLRQLVARSRQATAAGDPAASAGR